MRQKSKDRIEGWMEGGKPLRRTTKVGDTNQGRANVS